MRRACRIRRRRRRRPGPSRSRSAPSQIEGGCRGHRRHRAHRRPGRERRHRGERADLPLARSGLHRHGNGRGGGRGGARPSADRPRHRRRAKCGGHPRHPHHRAADDRERGYRRAGEAIRAGTGQERGADFRPLADAAACGADGQGHAARAARQLRPAQPTLRRHGRNSRQLAAADHRPSAHHGRGIDGGALGDARRNPQAGRRGVRAPPALRGRPRLYGRPQRRPSGSPPASACSRAGCCARST